MTFPLHHADSLPVQQQQRVPHVKASKRRSLSEGNKKKNNNKTHRGNKVVPIVNESKSCVPVAESQDNNNNDNVSNDNATTRRPHEEEMNHGPEYWISRQWRITSDDMLKPVPPYYPLEASTTLVLEDMHAEMISTRISQFLKRHSMACVFEPTRCECTSSQLTKFAVQLWKSSPQDAILLEVTRLHGSCLEMRKIRNGLFRYVTTGRNDCSLRMGRPAHCTAECVASTMHHHEQQAEEAAADALAISMTLLASPCVDQNMLGMESLRVLSNPTICSRDCARMLSRELVLGEHETHGLRNHLLKYFQNTQEPDEESSSLMEETEYEQGEYFGDLHHVALQVLVNALEVAVKQDSSTRTIQQHESLSSSSFFATLLDAFIYDLSVARNRPQEAAMSARCLVLLTELLGPGTITTKWVDVLFPIVLEAHEYGKVHHLQLETATHDLMELLWQHDR